MNNDDVLNSGKPEEKRKIFEKREEEEEEEREGEGEGEEEFFLLESRA